MVDMNGVAAFAKGYAPGMLQKVGLLPKDNIHFLPT